MEEGSSITLSHLDEDNNQWAHVPNSEDRGMEPEILLVCLKVTNTYDADIN